MIATTTWELWLLLEREFYGSEDHMWSLMRNVLSKYKVLASYPLSRVRPYSPSTVTYVALIVLVVFVACRPQISYIPPTEGVCPPGRFIF